MREFLVGNESGLEILGWHLAVASALLIGWHFARMYSRKSK
jgi:hypothetical protein